MNPRLWSLLLGVTALGAAACDRGAPPAHLARALGVQNGPVLSASPDGGADDFGWSVALSADWAVVGAPGALGGDGAVFVYDRRAGYALSGSVGGATGEHLGRGVAILGDGRVAAAGDSASGSVKILVKTSTWQVQGSLPVGSTDAGGGSGFPSSVAAAGGYVLVGAANHAHAASGGGAVYIFRWDTSVWTAAGELVPPQGPALFGQAVAMKGSQIVVGAPGASPGEVFVYDLADASWPAPVTNGTLTTGASGYDQFGQAVAVDTDTVLASAWNWATAPDRRAFAAVAPTWSPVGPLGTSDGAELATSVGVSDGLFVGGGVLNGNRAWARFLSATPHWLELVPAAANDGYGLRVAVADGREVLVAAPASAAPGQVHVFTVRRELDDPCGAPEQCQSGACSGGVCVVAPPQDAGGDAAGGDGGSGDGGGGDGGLSADGGGGDGGGGDGGGGDSGLSGDGGGGDGGLSGDGGGPADATADARSHRTDFYSCECAVGVAAVDTPGLLALLIGLALGARRRRSAR